MRPSDIADPYGEVLWGQARITFDIMVINEAQDYLQPTTALEKARSQYAKYGYE